MGYSAECAGGYRLGRKNGSRQTVSLAVQVTLVKERVSVGTPAPELADHMIQAGAFEAKFIAMRQVQDIDCRPRSAANAGKTASPAALTCMASKRSESTACCGWQAKRTFVMLAGAGRGTAGAIADT
jgi:hypothetical protein